MKRIMPGLVAFLLILCTGTSPLHKGPSGRLSMTRSSHWYRQGQYDRLSWSQRGVTGCRASAPVSITLMWPEPEQPGAPVLHPRPVREGRAALQARTGDLGKALGPDHPDVATSLNNWRELYSGPRPARAAAAALQARTGDLGKALGPNHPDVAQSLNTSRGCTKPKASTHRPSRSTSGHWRSRKRRSAPIIPLCHEPDNLAGLYQAKGQYAQAEPLFNRSLAIREKALGPDHLMWPRA